MKIIIEASAKEMTEFLRTAAENRPEVHEVDKEKLVQDLHKAFAGDLFKR